MSSKTDPYATPRARAADLILILLALLAILFAIWTAPQSHATSILKPAAAQSLVDTAQEPLTLISQ